MKDKRRKYDLSYFIKDGGKSKDISPSVNASEMNENEQKRRNKELNEELAGLDQNDSSDSSNVGINFEIENPDNEVEAAGNNNSNNNNNDDNSRENELERRRERNINAEIAESENRLTELIQQFELESHRNREPVDFTPVDINNPAAAVGDASFALNNARRAAQENTEKRKEKRLRALEKTMAANSLGLENESASRFGNSSSSSALTSSRSQAAQPKSSQKALSKNEIINNFFEDIATSTRPARNQLTQEQMIQFSQNPLEYITWAHDNLLTSQQRRAFRERNITMQELLTRLPRNLQEIFERLRVEYGSLSQLQRLRTTTPKIDQPILRLRPIQPTTPNIDQPILSPSPRPIQPTTPNIPLESPIIVNTPSISVNTPPIMANIMGRQLPPNSENSFKVSETEFKKKDPTLLIPVKIKKKQMLPNEQREWNEKYSKATTELTKLEVAKKIREIKKDMKNKKFSSDEEEYIKYTLEELENEHNKDKIDRILRNIDNFQKNIKRKESKKPEGKEKKDEETEGEKIESPTIEPTIEQLIEIEKEIEKYEKNIKNLERKQQLNGIKPGIYRLKIPTIEQLREELEATTNSDKKEKIEALIKKLENINKNKKQNEKKKKIELLAKGTTFQVRKELETTNNNAYRDELEKIMENLQQEINKQNVEKNYKKTIELLEKVKEEKNKRDLEKSKDKTDIIKKLRNDKKRRSKEIFAYEEKIKQAKKEKEQFLRNRQKGVFERLTPKEETKIKSFEEKIEKLEGEKKRLEIPVKKLEEDIKKYENNMKEKIEEEEMKKKSRKLDKNLQKEKEENQKRSSDTSEILKKYNEIFQIHKKLKSVDKNSKEYIDLSKERHSIYDKLSKNKNFSIQSRKEAKELISETFKKIYLEQLIEKYSDLFRLKSEEIMTNNIDKKSELKAMIKELKQKLLNERYYNKEDIRKVIEKFKNFSNKKEIEYKTRKQSENIIRSRKNQIKRIQQKFNEIAINKNFTPPTINETISTEKTGTTNGEEMKNKVEKGEETEKGEEAIKQPTNISVSKKNNKQLPKDRTFIQAIREKKNGYVLKKFLNNSVGILGNNDRAKLGKKDTIAFPKKFKPVRSAWAKKDNSQAVINSATPIKQTFPKDSAKVEKGKSYKKAVKSTKQKFPKDSAKVEKGVSYKNVVKKSINSSVQNSSPKEDTSYFTRIPTRDEIKIIKLIKKLPSKTIKIKDIKSEISGIQNKEIKKQLKSLLDKKLISITRK
jgi:hypothetical protein